ncbi:MAG: DUF1080 domain-containing protein [Bacteroidota bacterium]
MKNSVLLAFILVCCTSFMPARQWTQLIGNDLSQWEMYISYKLKNGYKGDAPVDSLGNLMKPVGYNKNINNMFSLIKENGESVIKVSGEYYGCLFTKKAFGNYHLIMQTKFGNKKWEPRLHELKDAGLLYHGNGPCGVDYFRSWMLSQEFQIQDTCTGDYWNIANAQTSVKCIQKANGEYQANLTDGAFVSMGVGTGKQGFCQRAANYENAGGEWNTIELICFEDKSVHIVNGRVVMVLQNSAYWDGTKSVAMTRGKLSLQSEACEVYYKNMRLKNIDKMPVEYAQYFK